MENQGVYRKAESTVNAKLAFYLHLASYAIVNVLLVVINLVTSPQYLWFLWSFLGWGVGICFHALIVFIFYGESSIKERMLKKEIDKNKGQL